MGLLKKQEKIKIKELEPVLRIINYKRINKGRTSVSYCWIYPTGILISFYPEGENKPQKIRKIIYYYYTYNSAGKNKIEDMKKLALSGSGLNTYINKHKPRYSEKR